jgi:hypothetical protein
MQREAHNHPNLKEKAIEELKEFWIIALYLAVFLTGFTFYRRMVLAEFGVTYLHYGIGLIEALVIAKVVLIGRALGLGKLSDRVPLILSVVYKALLFAVVTILFGVLEHVIDGLIHKDHWTTIMQKLLVVGTHELFARMIMLFISFVPFFAFWELGEALGRQKLIEMFFANREPPMAKA